MFSASAVIKMGFAPVAADYERENARRKKARYAALEGYKPDKYVKTVQGVQTLVAGEAAAQQKAPEFTHTITELIRNPQLEETARRVAMSDAERQYQEAAAKQKETKREHE